MMLISDVAGSVRDAADESICEVFSLMTGVPLTLETVQSGDDGIVSCLSQDRALIVLLAITGEIQGSLSLSLHTQAAIDWTHALIEHVADDIDQIVVDAVGELGNMFVGGVKRRLSAYDLKMSLPTVIRACDVCLVAPRNAFPDRMQYRYSTHVMTVLIVLRHL